MPLPLSIILPNYNHAHLIGGAIESVLSQSFGDFELLVIDDGSSDHSLEVIQVYLKKDARTKLIQHEKNRGIAEGFKSALAVARGKYLHGFSATDCYLPSFLEKTMHQLRAFPEIGICCTDVGLFSENPSQFIPYRILENAPATLVFPPSTIHKVFKYGHFSLPGLSTIMKRDSFLRNGGYRRELLFLCDTIVNQQIALSEGAIYIPETLIVFREPGYSKLSSSNAVIRNTALNNLREMLLQPENRKLLSRMRKAAVLGMMCKEQPFQCLKHYPLWGCYKNLIVRYFYKRMRRFLNKPLTSEAFLIKHIVDSVQNFTF